MPRVLVAGPQDAALFANMAPDVFDQPIDAQWLQTYLDAPHLHIAIALSGDLLVGMASGVTYHHPDKPTELFINEVGVAPDHQRQGLARALLGALFAHGAALGAHGAWVLTEADNAPACALYRSMGGTAEGDTLRMYTFDLPRSALAARPHPPHI